MVKQDVLLFFSNHTTAYPLYCMFETKLFKRFPKTVMRVQKSQITFSNRHVFACVSFARVKKKSELPNPFIVVTLGLPTPIESGRIAVKTEPYPGRWTHHIVLGTQQELDDELFLWLKEAYVFAESK